MSDTKRNFFCIHCGSFDLGFLAVRNETDFWFRCRRCRKTFIMNPRKDSIFHQAYINITGDIPIPWDLRPQPCAYYYWDVEKWRKEREDLIKRRDKQADRIDKWIYNRLPKLLTKWFPLSEDQIEKEG